jgi:hypothetical protein
MNKVVVVLGIIVLMTLAMLFFCVGFFTGSTISPTQITESLQSEPKKDTNRKITAQNIEELTDVKSATISDKIMDILSAAGSATGSLSSVFQSNGKGKNPKHIEGESKLTIDSLLREIATTHPPHDDCSYHKTMTQMHAPKPIVDKGLHGKKIVFVGYFKSNVAVQIQKLLTGKGYKTHVELSKSSEGNESFVFCGPFKKDENAKKLVTWLLGHDFSEAREVNITKEAIEETLFDIINEDSSLPENSEKDALEQNTTQNPTNVMKAKTVNPQFAHPAQINIPQLLR